jgi:tetratricopeptide (TPR) repeat protein
VDVLGTVDDRSEKNVSVLNAGLAVLVGLSLFVAAGVKAQDSEQGTSDQGTTELAMAAPEKVEAQLCLQPPATPPVVVEACTEALDAGRLQGIDRAHALVNRGMARRLLGDGAGADQDLRQAAAQYSAVISRTSPEANLIYARALIWHALGDADRALADYNVAARLDPTAPLLFLNRGILLAHYKSDYTLALVDFDQALQLKPADPQVLYRASRERAAAALAVKSFASR